MHKSGEEQKAATVNINRDLKLMQVLSEEVKARLMELSDRGHDINQLLSDLLSKREEIIEEEMENIGKLMRAEQTGNAPGSLPVTRYVPAKINRIVKAKYGRMCAEKGCNKRAEQLHHEKPFAIWKSHDPRHLKPLCRAHHELRHEGDVRVGRKIIGLS